MKKIISIILSVCLLFLVAGCSSAIKFDSQNEMVSHLKGIWAYEDNYYIISEDRIISTNDYSISSIMEDYFTAVIMDDKGDFSSLTAEETLIYVQDKLDGYQGETFYYNTKKGKIVFDNGKKSQKNFLVVDGGLEYKDK
ncbi:MAG: hypothetical protein UHM16_06680 [Acutalibacteraceae bacterium]|nr:hypothetical protein [Acutalibacteraceae bacterium]